MILSVAFPNCVDCPLSTRQGTKGPGYGDLIVCFEIVFPKELTTAQKDAIRAILAQ